MKTALVHDWLTSMAGSEKVLEAIHELYPSPIYTLVIDRKKMGNTFFGDKEIHSSFIQKFPFAEKKYRSYLPFFPLAIEQFDLSAYDLILSSSHCVAKGILPQPHQVHICYCHTPVRYAWDASLGYLRDAKLDRGVKGFVVKCALHYLRNWDIQSLPRVDRFIANSHFVRKRIERIYRREASVIYPPVDTDFYSLSREKGDYYLAASRLVSYKRIDLIVEAFSRMPERRLIVVGEGPEREAIEKRAGKNIEFLGYRTDGELRSLLQGARGFIFAACEDFGILPVEAMACGTPVLAYGGGGVLETVRAGETGFFFRGQTEESLQKALADFEKIEWDFDRIRLHAEQFGKGRFQREFSEEVEKWRSQLC